MDERYLYILLFLIFTISICSVFIVIKIAKNRKLDLKRWIFYAVYFNVFALVYLLIRQDGNVEDRY